MAELFGFEFKRKSKEDTSQLPSFSQKETDDGAVVIAAGGSFGTYVDLDGTVRTEAELVTKYREMSLHPECDSAVEEIVNESISIDEEDVININLEDLKVSENIKNAIKTEFQTCLQLLDFKRHAYDIYRRWYVDGRLYYHAVIDENSPKEGIKDVRYIDPRKIRKVREITRKRIQHGNPMDAVTTKTVNEYFIFNDKGFNYGNKVTGPTTAGLKIAKDSIVHVTSGLTDNQGTMVLSYLHKAIKALNQLRTLEDSLVIYRLARAPERRIWYIDVGNLPKMKAEQYVRDIMVKHKNRLIYDAQSGEIRDDRKFMTMLEDYWLPRREGGRGTEVTTLPGGQTLGQMDDVLYFQKKFLQTLNVPVSRLNSDAVFSIGRATEITRDELKFARFIIRLRTKFSDLFIKMLEKQLVLKGIMTLEDWEQIRQDIKFDYARDNYFTELKNAEIYNNRLSLAGSYQNFTGKYYSHEWVRRNILRQTDDDMKTMDSQIQKEKSSDDPRWINPAIDQNLQMELQTQSMVQQNQQMAQQNAQPQQQGGAPIDPNVGATQDPQMQQKMQEIRNAKMIVDKLKGTTPAGRSIQDQSKYKAAVQILAKNRDLAAQLGMTQ
jgi:hypothetical protein